MKKAFFYSFKKSIPVLVSFLPVGIAYGLLMQTAGYNWVWTGLASIFVFAGSLQYLMVTFFVGGTSLIIVALMALLLNSRHIFYGIPFIEKWKDYGPAKLFLIFALPDESFSLHCANTFSDRDPKLKKYTYVFTALLNYLYWIIASILGALIGSLIHFNTAGIDFAMTAMFIVIFIEQIMPPNKKFLKNKNQKSELTATDSYDGGLINVPQDVSANYSNTNAPSSNDSGLENAHKKHSAKHSSGILNAGRLPALFALVSSILCLVIIGPANFILPSLAITVVLLFLFRRPIENYLNDQEVTK